MCEGCTNPTGGIYTAGCRACALRSIARGPEFHASAVAKVITPAYAARLQQFGPVEAVHAEVKRIAAELKAPQGTLL